MPPHWWLFANINYQRKYFAFRVISPSQSSVSSACVLSEEKRQVGIANLVESKLALGRLDVFGAHPPCQLTDVLPVSLP